MNEGSERLLKCWACWTYRRGVPYLSSMWPPEDKASSWVTKAAILQMDTEERQSFGGERMRQSILPRVLIPETAEKDPFRLWRFVSQLAHPSHLLKERQLYSLSIYSNIYIVVYNKYAEEFGRFERGWAVFLGYKVLELLFNFEPTNCKFQGSVTDRTNSNELVQGLKDPTSQISD